MKYAAFERNEEGVPVEKVSDIFKTSREAEDWWVTHVIDPDTNQPRGEFEGKDLALYPVSEDGLPMEQIPDNDAELAKRDSERLLSGNVDAHFAYTAMIAARQLYALGLTELSRVVENEPELHDMTTEFLIQAAAHKAQKFESEHMLDMLEKAVLPWATNMSNALALAEEQERKKIADEQEQERLDSLVPVGISTVKDGPTDMSRETPILLVGDPMATNVLLDDAQTKVLAARSDKAPYNFTVVRCSLFNEDMPRLDPDKRLVNVPVALWRDATKTAKGFAEAMQRYVYDHLQAAPDLLIIDDLLSVTPSLPDQEGPACGDALKRVSDWCKEVGCALIAGIHMPNIPDLTTYKWDRVNKFSALRPVSVETVEEDKELRRITVGRDAFEYVVHRDILNHPNLVIE